MLSEGVLLCCCCCCGQIGAACKRLLGPRKVTKINYLITVLAFIIPVILLAYLLNLIVKWINLTPNQVIARSSLSMLLLFLIMLIIIACKNKVSMVINEGLFTVKYIVIVLLFIISLFLSSNIFEVYSSIARIISLLYMAIQSVILIDLFYIGGVQLVKRYNQGEQECGGTLIGFSVIFFSAAISLNVFSYNHFSNDGCGNTLWLNIVVSVLIVFLPIIQLLQLNLQNNLLTTSFVSLLIAYFAYSGQLSFGQGCKGRLTTLTYILDVVVNLFLFILTTYGTISGGLNEDPQIERVGSQGEQQQIGIKEYSQTNIWVKWHFYMCLASIYLCMVFTNWLSIQNVGVELQGSDFAFYVRVGACIGSGLIYIWAMIAPAIFPQRTFELQ